MVAIRSVFLLPKASPAVAAVVSYLLIASLSRAREITKQKDKHEVSISAQPWEDHLPFISDYAR